MGDWMSEELQLLRQLERNVRERRVAEPKHSREDHECEECAILVELSKLGRNLRPIARHDLKMKNVDHDTFIVCRNCSAAYLSPPWTISDVMAREFCDGSSQKI